MFVPVIMHVCVCVCVCAYMNACVCVCVHECVCVCVCAYMHACVHVYMCVCTNCASSNDAWIPTVAVVKECLVSFFDLITKKIPCLEDNKSNNCYNQQTLNHI